MNENRIVSLIENSVNLDAYAKSNGFIGYTESNAFPQGKMSALQFIDQRLDQYLPEETILALRITNAVDLAKLSTNKVNAFLELDCNKLLMLNQSVDQIEWKLIPIIKGDLGLFRTISELIFDQLIAGHVFLCLLAQDTILYPHQDIGLGAILGNDAIDDSVAKKILREFTESSNFRLILT